MPGATAEPDQCGEYRQRHYARLHQREVIADARQAWLGTACACGERPAVVCAFADERHELRRLALLDAGQRFELMERGR